MFGPLEAIVFETAAAAVTTALVSFAAQELMSNSQNRSQLARFQVTQ